MKLIWQPFWVASSHRWCLSVSEANPRQAAAEAAMCAVFIPFAADG